MSSARDEAPGVHHMRALGTTVTVAVDCPDRIVGAEAILVDELDAIDLGVQPIPSGF